MTQHRTRVSPLLFTTLTLTTLIVALTLAIWGLLSGVLRTPADGLGNPDVATGASRYVAQRPLDPAGWLAWAGTRRLLVSDAALGGKIVDTASSLGPVDPQVLRAQALLAFQQGDVGAGLDRVADLASAFPAEAGDAFAVMRDHAGHRDWAKFWAARLARRWPAADSFLLYSCQSGASLSTLFALAQPAVSQ